MYSGRKIKFKNEEKPSKYQYKWKKKSNQICKSTKSFLWPLDCLKRCTMSAVTAFATRVFHSVQC